jgi:hypothetical protein
MNFLNVLLISSISSQCELLRKLPVPSQCVNPSSEFLVPALVLLAF